jgi:hypothetical protein
MPTVRSDVSAGGVASGQGQVASRFFIRIKLQGWRRSHRRLQHDCEIRCGTHYFLDGVMGMRPHGKD